jgi:hypothetical protein
MRLENEPSANLGVDRADALFPSGKGAAAGRSLLHRQAMGALGGTRAMACRNQHGTMRKTKHRGMAAVTADFLLNLIAYDPGVARLAQARTQGTSPKSLSRTTRSYGSLALLTRYSNSPSLSGNFLVTVHAPPGTFRLWEGLRNTV